MLREKEDLARSLAKRTPSILLFFIPEAKEGSLSRVSYEPTHTPRVVHYIQPPLFSHTTVL